MRKALFGALTAFLLLAAGAAQAEEIKWAKNFDQAMKLAKSTGKLVMLDFYTDW